jgi:hypothetical protein
MPEIMRRYFGKLAGFWLHLYAPFHYDFLLISDEPRNAWPARIRPADLRA